MGLNKHCFSFNIQNLIVFFILNMLLGLILKISSFNIALFIQCHVFKP